MKQHDPEQLMTTAEVAALVRVDGATLRRWSNEGKAPPKYGTGKKTRWRRAEVLRFIAAGLEWPDSHELRRRENGGQGDAA